jgi:hypothetical protein
METLSGYDVIVENPKRSQMFFLATIEKPRSIDEVAQIWGVSRGTFFSRGLDKKMIRAKLLRVVGYEKRALKFEANFEGLADYLKKSAEHFLNSTQKMEDTLKKAISEKFGEKVEEAVRFPSSLFASFISSIPNLILILDTKEIRSLFSEDFLKLLNYRKFLFDDRFLLFGLISNFLQEASFIIKVLEKSEKEKWDDLKMGDYLLYSYLYFLDELGNIPTPLIHEPDNFQIVKQIKDKIVSLPFYNEYINFQKQSLESQKDVYEKLYNLFV